MKIGLITDTHYNFKKANQSFHDYFAKFYNDIFFPTLKKENIKTVVHLGDAFDNRRGVDYWALKWAKENVYDKFLNLGIEVYNIVGNHDSYYKNTNDVNAVDILLREYENVIKISSPKEYTVGGIDSVFLPWICSDNEKQVVELLNKSEAKVVYGHLELSGFLAFPGHVHTDGMNKDIFNKFDRVFSGHYHTRSDDGKIYYLGNPYQMFWSDVDDLRGFHIFDTDTFEMTFIKNPYNMFERIYYNDEKYKEFSFSPVQNKMVKLIVNKKEDYKNFEKCVDKILKENPMELKIIETTTLSDDSVEFSDIECEDTWTILDKYVEESEFNLDKSIVKKLIREVYKEALEIE